MLKQVKVNIPLLHVVKQVRVIIECKTLVEYKDRGCPTISITIEDEFMEKTLLDLRARDNLLLYSLYKKLDSGNPK